MGRLVRLTEAHNESSTRQRCWVSGSFGIMWTDEDDETEGDDDDDDEGLSDMDSVVSGRR